MKETPIIMQPESVRGILAGTKTQTRRIAKVPEYVRGSEAPQKKRGEAPKHAEPYFDAYDGGPFWCWWDEYDRQGDGIKCPYGVAGERLWVKESWAMNDPPSGAIYRADDPSNHWLMDGKWKNPMFIPRQYSRLTLEITGLRVGRVQDISESDAKAEGVEPANAGQDGDGPIKTYRTVVEDGKVFIEV